MKKVPNLFRFIHCYRHVTGVLSICKIKLKTIDLIILLLTHPALLSILLLNKQAGIVYKF
jgi:hypothetical protein